MMNDALTFEDRRMLVVGGAGFVGSNLVLQLLQHGPARIVIVDNLLSSDVSNVPVDPSVDFVYGSIVDDAVLALLPRDLDFVFHLSCFHGNQSSIADPLADHENNTLASLKLFNALRTFPHLQKVVYAAAGCAVAEKTFNDARPTDEDAPVSLYHDTPYSISKLIGEMYGNYFFQRYGLPVVKARFQNVFGPREILGAGRWRGTVHTVWRNVTPTFIWRSLNREALPLDNGGRGSRDFIFVEDIARGLMACALKGAAGGVYNLASGVETTVLELARAINDLTGNPTPVDVRPARDWDRSGKRLGSTEKSLRELGFKHQVPLHEGLRRTIEWTRANEARIRRCIGQHDFFMNQLQPLL
jgi:UDP-glucose 4-epimerase